MEQRIGPHAGVPVVRPSAPALSAERWLEKPEYLGHGWVCDVWADDERVIKIGREVVPQAELMPVRDDTKRQVLARHSVWVIEALRSSPDFAHFAHLLPQTSLPAPFVLEQERQRGKLFDELSEHAQERAEESRVRIMEAARQALPGVEIDISPGSRNLLFDDAGEPVGLYDPAGAAGWASSWRPGDPVGRDLKVAAEHLIARRAASPGEAPLQPIEPLMPLAGTYFKRAVGDELTKKDAMLVVNVDKNAAFLVQRQFKAAYESRDFAQTCGGQLSNVLGAPVEEQHESPKGSGRLTQHFENGVLSWSEASGMRLTLRPAAQVATSLIHARWAEGGWLTAGSLEPLAGSYARRVEGDRLRNFGDAFLVANPAANGAFFLKGPFRHAFESTLFAPSELKPLHRVLGLPTSDEQADGACGRLRQTFEHGELTWSPTEGVALELHPR